MNTLRIITLSFILQRTAQSLKCDVLSVENSSRRFKVGYEHVPLTTAEGVELARQRLRP